MMFRHFTFLLVLIALIPAPIVAADSKFYIGGSLGYANHNQDDPLVAGPFLAVNADFPLTAVDSRARLFAAPAAVATPIPVGGFVANAIIPSNANVDDEDLGWKIQTGYRLNQYFGAEFAYIDLGETEVSSSSTVNLTAGTITSNSRSTSSVTAIEFVGIARFPVMDKVNLLGKLGGVYWEADFETTFSTSVTGSVALISPLNPISFSADDEGTNLIFGAGIEYAFNDKIGIRAEWERFNNIGSSDTDIDFFNVGINYRFNF